MFGKHDNIEYGGVGQNGNSAYDAIVDHKVVCQGYSAISSLFFNRAGIEGIAVIGITKGSHAWNWVHLGEDWYAYDSTDSREGLFLKALDGSYHRKYYTYVNGELEYGFPITDVDYQYKAYPWQDPKDKPLFYQKEATDSGLIGSNLRWTLKKGLLTIKGNGPMRDFENETLVPWKNFFNDITDLKIEECVTTIGDYAFYYVKTLKYENCQDKLGSIKSIGKNTFSDIDKFVEDLKDKAKSKCYHIFIK
ncbi:transglutaminase domain-containing protein [Histomonas meleagridis]|uniref:transglutaminase domain-containing protein n=1 Tax=Histomonas meleagridis TaxID=135588 RepID=UPI003559F777|nr:transglutaminase domain-containing protein [Histomonas meleagridis]KAH0801940.1 transglutaminase domain-containing protein [Histomonas meleagridis]